jgi:hypothetical protein
MVSVALSYTAGNQLPWLCLGALWWARPRWDLGRWVLGYPQLSDRNGVGNGDAGTSSAEVPDDL